MGRKSLASERRAQILDAFYRCVTRDGLDSASIRQVAKEAGVQPSILHHYFKNRDEMVEEMVKNIVDEISTRYLGEIQPDQKPAARFNKAIEFLFGPHMINDEQAIFFYDSWAEAKRNKRVHGSFKMLYNRFRKDIVDLLAGTWKDSNLSSTDMEDLATMIIAIQDGISLQWDMDPDNVSLKKMSRMTKRLIELYIEDKQRGKVREKAARLRRTSKPSEAG